MKILDMIFGKREVEMPSVGADEKHNGAFSSGGIFQFEVADVFFITGRGTVVVGQVMSGTINVGDEVTLERTGKRTVVTGIEMFRKKVNTASQGDKIGILLNDVNRDEVVRGERIYR